MPDYRAYGFSISSDLELPALQSAQTGADVTIRAGTVSAEGIGGMQFRNWEAMPGAFRIHFPEAGRVAVNSGREIIYDRRAGADDSQIASVLLGTGLAVVMMQRRRLPLHSCAVATPDGALLVMGKSGAGKSTMLTGLLELGFPMIADDLTGIDIAEDGAAMAVPGFPAVRLWPDSLALAGTSVQGLASVRSDIAKFYLPVPRFCDSPVPIRAIAYLSAHNGEDVRIRQMPAPHRIEALSRFIFRKNFLKGLGLQRFAFDTVAATVRRAELFEIHRPTNAVSPRKMAQRLIAALRA